VRIRHYPVTVNAEKLDRQVTAATGDRIPGKVGQIRRGVSQETGSADTNFRGEK
jgi:hypothetical protein